MVIIIWDAAKTNRRQPYIRIQSTEGITLYYFIMVIYGLIYILFDEYYIFPNTVWATTDGLRNI